MKYLGTLAIILMITAGPLAQAQTETTSVVSVEDFERPKSVKERLQQQKEQYQESITKAQELRKTPEEDLGKKLKTNEETKEKRINFVTRIKTTVDRLKGMHARIEARTDELEDLGYKTREAQDYLREAERGIRNIEDEVVSIEKLIMELNNETNESEITRLKQEIREEYTDMKTGIKEIHQNLVFSLNSLKQAFNIEEAEKENKDTDISNEETPTETEEETFDTNENLIEETNESTETN